MSIFRLFRLLCTRWATGNESLPLGHLRVATPADVERLGVVCTAGFYYTEEFRWERIYHEQYPQSTIVHYRHEAVNFIKRPDVIVLVVEDDYEPEESSATQARIPVRNGWAPPQAGTKVVVGLGVWKLGQGSKRVENFPELPVYDHKDLDKKRAEGFAKAVAAAEETYVHELPSLERIVVHPAYWRRGHGTELATWGIKLSDVDGVDQVVFANSMGEKLFRKVSYEFLLSIPVQGDEKDPRGTDFAVLKHLARISLD